MALTLLKTSFLLLTLAVPCAAQTPAYTVTDLGTLGGLSSTAAAVNNTGQVVGTSECEDGKHAHAFFFDGSHMLDMGTLGGTDSSATSVNDSGQVVGKADVAGDDLSHAFLWQNGSMSDLHLADKANSEANGINASGHITGGISASVKIKDGVIFGDFTQPDRVFLLMRHTIALLPAPAHVNPGTFGLSDADAVVGFVPEVGSDYERYACIWQGKKSVQLKSLGGRISEARAMNTRGQTVGRAALRHNKPIHACLWQNELIQDLGTVGGDNSQANAINSKGQIVGWSDASDKKSQHAFLYDNGHITDLNSLIDHKYGWVLLEATGISDTGYICGTGTIDGLAHAFLLTPAPAK